MNIDETNIVDGNDEELALACLLSSRVLFTNAVDTNLQYSIKSENPNWTTCVYVNCNDVFAWGCSDTENLSDSEIIDLYKLHKEWGSDGVVKWVCIKRNEQPQDPIKEKMIKANHWDDVLENLKPNHYWSKLKENKK